MKDKKKTIVTVVAAVIVLGVIGKLMGKDGNTTNTTQAPQTTVATEQRTDQPTELSTEKSMTKEDLNSKIASVSKDTNLKIDMSGNSAIWDIIAIHSPEMNDNLKKKSS